MRSLLSKYMTKINLFAYIRRFLMRRNLKNTDMTFLCPNCIGGMLFHDLGLKFQSPTVNLMIKQKDFIKFVLNYEQYIQKKLIFFSHPYYQCPCARLDDIIIHFTHYKTEEEAEKKWYERCKRINKQNLFICVMEKDGLTKEEILSLKSIQAKGLVVFTANEYPDIPYTLFVKKYNADGRIGNILKKNHFLDSKEYERYFDFVAWFNNANGKNFDISQFKK